MQRIVVDVEMIDGRKYEKVRVFLADMIRYSDVARRHKWGSMEEDTIRAISFMAYAAMVRTGLYDGDKGFDEFAAEVAWIENEESEPVDPTQAAIHGA